MGAVRVGPRASSVAGTAVVAGPEGRRTGRVVDLTGEDLGPFTGEIGLAPWQIVTLRLDEP